MDPSLVCKETLERSIKIFIIENSGHSVCSWTLIVCKLLTFQREESLEKFLRGTIVPGRMGKFKVIYHRYHGIYTEI